MKKPDILYNYFWGLLILLILVPSCTKRTTLPKEEIKELVIDGWTIKSSDLDIDITNPQLLFTTASSGYIIGGMGKIYFTSDSGKTWISQNSGTTLNLTSISFIDNNIGFISGKGMRGCADSDCGKGSFLLKTSDGGNHWNKVFYDSLAYLEIMHFQDSNTGFAVIEYTERIGERYKFLVKTIDGGKTWTKISINLPPSRYDKFKFLMIQKVYYLIGDYNKLLKSTDLGLSWQSYDTPISASNEFLDVYFFNKDIGFIQDYGNTFKTINGGLTWLKLIDKTTWFQSVHFYSELNAFGIDLVSVYDGGEFPSFKGINIFTTNDGGITWNRSGFYENVWLGYPVFPDLNIGYSLVNTKLYRFTRNQFSNN